MSGKKETEEVKSNDRIGLLRALGVSEKHIEIVMMERERKKDEPVVENEYVGGEIRVRVDGSIFIVNDGQSIISTSELDKMRAMIGAHK